MNIAILITDISRTGGTERAVVTLANMLCKKYNIVKIVSLTKTTNKKSYYKIDRRVEVDFLNNEPLHIGLLSKIKWSVKTVFLLRNYFRNNNIDIIISTGHNNNWLIPFVRNKRELKIIACEHIVYSSIPKISRFFMSLTYPYLDKIVVLSQKAKESFIKYSKVSIIPNAISFKPEFLSQLTKKKILMVGRLSSEKGLERLIPIATKLKEKFSDWLIVIVGEGPERELLERLIKESGLEDFIILEGMQQNIETYYVDSSIYIMTSHFEAFPMVLLEAQSFGLPIVVYNCPEGPGQIVRNNESGFLIENNNADEFIDKISMLIENQNLRQDFGKKAKMNTDIFSEKEIVKKWILLFEEIIN
ncbi:glycosyltransferase family 4 protein [Flavobacterium hercynium]|uniref:Glycosyl transferase family 1 domain-containing protein n=1 Tax=Flavobacterium hercynium TaxID=387094 RepID=A0A226HDF7_9FLAO|nr:glycosyltransferase family 4 protein [Flavobacterium hercynium]OXA92192.1 hypothetical protein B0A66_10530 [Flavobacterium hercynium]SMP24529.1 Glycosyltransferase involved in cell wall bisynthesis [Flavobacterium hercynium]